MKIITQFKSAFLCTFLMPLLATAQMMPITDKDILSFETSRTVSVGWSSNTWSNYQASKSPINLTRTSDGAHILSGGSLALTIDIESFYQFQDSGFPKFVEKKSTRDGKPLTTGLAWKAEVTYVGTPVAWCSSTNNSKFESKFEVGAAEKYALKINDVDTTIEVLPVLEKGYWYRCYSGRRVIRSLYSKELDAVVSLEYISYNTQGQVHESSFRYNMKEIKRQP